jgi:hypothetical protein
MTTLRQIEANRRNSTRSTGPKTVEGKRASRVNATTHGLSGTGVVRTDEESARVAERIDQWRTNFQPADAYEDWLIEQAVLHSVRLERCSAHDWALRMLSIERAESSWDEDRRLAADELGARLAKQPALIARRLRRTRQGCGWLLERWMALAALLRGGRDWTDAQRALALDLLGTAGELRDGPTRLDPPGVEGLELRAARLAVVEAEVAALEALRDEALADLDESERTAAEMGFSPEPDRAILIVMRYESASSRRMLWALNQLRGRKRPEAVAEPSRPRPASPLTSPPSPGPVDLPPSLPKCSLSDTFADIPPASSSEPPEPPAAPEPATSRPASSGPILAPVTESPALSLRFDAATATAETPAPSRPHQEGMASLFASPSATARNRRARRAQLSRERRG